MYLIVDFVNVYQVFDIIVFYIVIYNLYVVIYIVINFFSACKSIPADGQPSLIEINTNIES